MRLLVLLVLLVPLFALSGPLAAADAKPSYEVIDWSKAPAGLPGDTAGELKHPLKNSLVMRYRVYAPAALPEKRTLGLILAVHGMGADENSLTSYAHSASDEAGIAQGYVVAGGKSQGAGWDPADDGRLMQFLDWLRTVYPIDQRRIFIWGHSNGGHTTARFAAEHTDLFAAALPMSGYSLPVPGGKDPGTTMLEYYLVHGDADPTCSVEASREMRRALIGQGFRCVYREIHGADHVNVLGNVPVRRDAARWLDAIRHKQVPLPAPEQKWLKQVALDKGGELLASRQTWDELVRIGGAAGWAAAAHAAKAKEAPVRLALAQACAHVCFAGDETVAALAKLADDEDAAVRVAAIAALGMHANWRSPAAQIALGKLALNKKKSADDRAAAGAALAGALPLPLLGNYGDDAPLFDASVALLDSELAEIRAAIAAPLQTAVAGALGYDPAAEAPARKAPIAAWRTWFAERAVAGGAKGAKK